MFAKRLFALTVLPLLLLGGSYAQEDVTVRAYINTGALNRLPEGSNPERFEEVNEVVAQQTSVRIDPVRPPTGDAGTELLNLLLSSPDEQLDMFSGSWTEYAPIATPLNDLLEQYGQNILATWPEESWAKMTDAEGNIMGIPRTGAIAPYPVWVRTDQLEALGLEMPTTIDELETYLAAFQESQPQGIPLLGNLGNLQQAFLGAFTEYGNSNWVDPEDNRLKPAILQPGYEDFVATMADWYAQGYLSADTFGETDTEVLRDAVRSQRVGAAATWYSVITLVAPALQEANPDISYAYTNLTGPLGDAQTLSPPSTSGIIISQRAADPAAIIRFIDWQYRDVANHLTALYGIEGTDWTFIEEAEGAEGLVEGTRLLEVAPPEQTGYSGELSWSFGPLEQRYATVNNGRVDQHAQHLNCCLSDLSAGKMPVDATVAYDEATIRQLYPNEEDFNRYLEENLSLFITGARPMSDWQAFIEGLSDVGLEQRIDAYTTVFNQAQE